MKKEILRNLFFYGFIIVIGWYIYKKIFGKSNNIVNRTIDSVLDVIYPTTINKPISKVNNGILPAWRLVQDAYISGNYDDITKEVWSKAYEQEPNSIPVRKVGVANGYATTMQRLKWGMYNA